MSTTTHIIPTVGRIVWFYPHTGPASPDFLKPAAGEPLAAIIAAVLLGQAADIVNLTVLDAVGTPHAISMVPLIQEGQDVPKNDSYATWMPCQVEQAKKAEGQVQASTMVGAVGYAIDASHLRVEALNMALRTYQGNHRDVLTAATAYQAHIEGKAAPNSIETKAYANGTSATGPAPVPNLSPAQQDARIVGGWAVADHFDFGLAIHALKCGKKVARAGWNGKGMWLAYTPGSVIPPEAARSGACKAKVEAEGAAPITILPHIDMRAADGSIVIGWLASQTDMLAEDWLIVE